MIIYHSHGYEKVWRNQRCNQKP